MPSRNPSNSHKATNGQSAVGLTPRQAEVERAIERFRAQKGYSPTLAEIASLFNVAKMTAYQYVLALCDLGIYQRAKNETRTIVRTQVPYYVKERR